MLVAVTGAQVVGVMVAWCVLVVLVIGWIAYRFGRARGWRAHHKHVLALVPKIDADMRERHRDAFYAGYAAGEHAALDRQAALEESTQPPADRPRSLLSVLFGRRA